MKFRRRAGEELTVNITPLIDVVFLLLIFFMVTTTFTRETRLAVNLPEADAVLAQEMPEQIEVVVAVDGSYAINGNVLVNNNLSTLMRGLEQVAGEDRSMPVLLIADAEATHQAVVSAMDALGQMGFNRFSIATRRPLENEAGR
ncbi:MAG: biopolymer transporter ExbD [Pseudohongiellaceae bacterium]